MTDLNHVVLIGRLTQDLGADERSFGYVANGQARANVSIAVNRSKKNGDQWVEETYFFNITIWGKTAENLKPYLTKGKQICVEGHLKQDRWEKDGQKQSRISIVADNVQLLGGKSEGNSDGTGYGQQGGSYAPPKQNFTPKSQPQQQSFDTGADDFPEDIPF